MNFVTDHQQTHTHTQLNRMDQTKHHNLLTSSPFMQSQFVGKLIKLLLSVSVFSFCFSCSPWLSHFFNFFNFCFFTFPFRLLTHTIDRKCMFLLCNGILVFIVRSSGLIGSTSSGSDRSHGFFKKNEDALPMGSSVLEDKVSLILLEEEVVERSGSLENVAVEEGRENEYHLIKKGERETKKLEAEFEEQETQTGFALTEEDKEERERGTGSFIEEEEEENGLLSTEELNRKFDDFIRRMKEEMRIEAQQQLVMV